VSGRSWDKSPAGLANPGGISEGRVSMERDKQIADPVVDVCVCVTLDLGCRG